MYARGSVQIHGEQYDGLPWGGGLLKDFANRSGCKKEMEEDIHTRSGTNSLQEHNSNPYNILFDR